MANPLKTEFLKQLANRVGQLKRIGRSHSLFEVVDGGARIYIRYSKMHGRNQAFYGLRDIDLKALAGYRSVICFLWDGQREPLCVPFSEYEDVFRDVVPATDGQYKVQVYNYDEGIELYIARAGRFNVESNLGWSAVERLGATHRLDLPELSHSQVQTLLGAIGTAKGLGIWVPPSDRHKMDWSISKKFGCEAMLPENLKSIGHVVEEIDVIWVKRGTGTTCAFFEVEHSTPIYTGLLRFNDVHLLSPQIGATFTIVSNDSRRARFVRQLRRPTFKTSGLSEVCNFLEYRNVYEWHVRTI